MWDIVRIILVIINLIVVGLFIKHIFLDKSKTMTRPLSPIDIHQIVEEEIQRRSVNGRQRKIGYETG